MFACAKCGMDMVCASPEGYQPNPEIVSMAQADAKETGASITVEADVMQAVQGADVLYTDVWASMGEEAEKKNVCKLCIIIKSIKKYLLKPLKMQFPLHCLPAHRGEEITEEVLEGKQSVVFDQAENRLHVQKAIMTLLME